MTQQETLKRKQAISSFATNVCALLEADGHYNPNDPETVHRLSQDIARWQEPERRRPHDDTAAPDDDKVVPYDCALVSCWLNGSILMPELAWDGLCQYLASANVPESTLEALSSRRETIEDYVLDNYPFGMHELNQTLAAQLKTQRGLQLHLANHLQLSQPTITHLCVGISPILLKKAAQIDAALNAIGVARDTRLADLFWYINSEQTARLWTEASSFGEKLRVLRESVGLEPSELAAKIDGLNRASLNQYENGAKMHQSEYIYCPSHTQLEAIFSVIEAEQDRLNQAHPSHFSPLLDNAVKAQMRRAREALEDDRRTCDPIPKERLEELAVLNQAGVSTADVGAVCFGSPRNGHYARKVAQERWGEDFSGLSEEQRNQAMRRLEMLGLLKDGKPTTHLGSAKRKIKDPTSERNL